MLDKVAAGVGVVLLQRLEDLRERHIVTRVSRSGLMMTWYCFTRPPKEFTSVTPGHGAQDRAHDVILHRAQLGRVVFRVLADERVLENFAKPCGDRSELDIDARRQAFAQRSAAARSPAGARSNRPPRPRTRS